MGGRVGRDGGVEKGGVEEEAEGGNAAECEKDRCWPPHLWLALHVHLLLEVEVLCQRRNHYFPGKPNGSKVTQKHGEGMKEELHAMGKLR